jgi:cyclopropane-fatty-acyl-phospholipid synthase
MLRREIETRIPERPFTVEFWDGTKLPATNGGGPTFFIRSPRAAAHALRAPGQLGLGRAYVSGEIEVDDMDAVIEVLDSWQPPSLDRGDH